MSAPREKHPAGCVEIGTPVRFLLNKLGASRRDQLFAVTGDDFGIGDGGVVAFAHPNQKACRGWVYVEVESKVTDEKLYVGVGPSMVAYRGALPLGAIHVLRLCDEDEPNRLSNGDAKVAEVLAKRGLLELCPGCTATYDTTEAGREMLCMNGGAS